VLIGGIIPLFLIYSPAFNKSTFAIITAPLLVIIGGLCQVYIIVIGGQAYPMNLFPGKEVVESGFFDGIVASYSPTIAETLLGLGGIVITLIIMVVTSRMLPLLPDRLEDPDNM
jgi:molybdopterin-containing oxidoreductase family membrane subunit